MESPDQREKMNEPGIGMSPIPPQGRIKTPDHNLVGATHSLSSPELSSQMCIFIFNKSFLLSCICLILEFFLAWRQEPCHCCSEQSLLLDIPMSLQQNFHSINDRFNYIIYFIYPFFSNIFVFGLVTELYNKQVVCCQSIKNKNNHKKLIL